MSTLLAVSLVSLIVLIDLIMGHNFSGVIKKGLNPFQVMEPGEYVIVFLFVFYIVIKTVYSTVKKKYTENSNQNESNS
ncbi:hypothetical protein [Neobacillus sp. FSL H8-0543]|uniref:hypothetical protein n=1 Tax=Neobacillus sp. FSL H8-0543 TaxID=2954672 RepID=UPI0031593843